MKAEQKNAKICQHYFIMQDVIKNDRKNQSSQSLITDCHLCCRQTKGFIAAAMMIMVAGCQPVTMSSPPIPLSTTAASSQIQQASPVTKLPAASGSSNQTRSIINRTTQDGPSDVKRSDQGSTTDLATANAIMDSIIWQFQTDDKLLKNKEIIFYQEVML